MPRIARILLLIKIFGIALGVIVVALTFHAQNEATKTADSLPTAGIELNVPKPPANATEAERELFYSKLIQSWIFKNAQALKNEQDRHRFIETFMSNPRIKYIGILGGICLVIGECWQFFRNPNPKEKTSAALAVIPIESAADASITVSQAAPAPVPEKEPAAPVQDSKTE